MENNVLETSKEDENKVMETPETNGQVVETPKEEPTIVLEAPQIIIKDVRIVRLSSIFFNMSITCLAVIMLALLSSIIIPIFHGLVIVGAALLLILSFILVIVTFGLILLDENSPTRVLMNFIENSNMDKAMAVSKKFISTLPYLCIIGMLCAAISIIAICFSKGKKTGRIVGLSVVIVVLATTLVLYYVLGGELWQS